jgi:hypothetical protein
MFLAMALERAVWRSCSFCASGTDIVGGTRPPSASSFSRASGSAMAVARCLFGAATSATSSSMLFAGSPLRASTAIGKLPRGATSLLVQRLRAHSLDALVLDLRSLDPA